MMVAQLLEHLRQQGIDLWVEGDRLRFRAPKGVMTPGQRSELVKDRAAIIAELRRQAAATSRVRPLSFSQRSLWFLHLQAPRSTAYHVTMSMRVLSELQRDALREAVQALLDRHAILRTTYDFVDDTPSARVAGQATAAVSEHDARDQSDDALRAAIEADYSRPFDLATGPLLRVSLYSRAAADHVLLLTIHHIAADGWSLLLLFQELTKLYAEFAGGPRAGLSRPTVEYAEYVSWQQQMLDGAEGERLWSFWRGELAEPRAELRLPGDRPRPETESFSGASLAVNLNVDLTERLKVLARAENTTLFVVLLASFHAFLHRLTGTDDIIVGAPAFGRSKPEFLSVVGDFVNTVPLRARVRSSATLRELIREERRVVQGALDAQEYPLPLIVERLKPARQAGRTPLVDAFFALQRFDQFRQLEALLAGDAGAETDCEGLRLAAYPLDQQEGQFDFALQFVERAGVLHGVFKYSSDMFEGSTIAAWAGGYRSLVEALVADPDSTVSALPRPAAPPQLAANRAAELMRAADALDIRLAPDAVLPPDTGATEQPSSCPNASPADGEREELRF